MAAPATSPSPAPYWKCLAAAMPLLVTGIGYVLALQSGSSAGTPPHRWLVEGMRAEQTVLGTMFVMLIVGWFFRDADRFGGFRFTGFMVCAFVFVSTSAVLSYGSLEGWLLFMVLTPVTFAGLALNWNSTGFWFQFLVRWMVSTAVLWLSLRHASVVEAGAIYFLALAGVELSGFYQRWLPAFVRRAADGFRKTG